MKNKIYILEKNSRGINYGIGTYIKQLINLLLSAKMDFCIIRLYAECIETTIISENGYQLILIPSPQNATYADLPKYSRNICYLLKTIILEQKETELIFHINFMADSNLTKYLKRLFKCRIILTIHYTNWSFNLLGDFNLLKKIIQERRNKLTQQEKFIVDDIKETTKMIKKCDQLIFVAQHTLQTLNEINCIGNKETYVIGNGIANSFKDKQKNRKNELRRKYHIDENTSIILFAGRIDEVKGVTFLIQAFERVLKTYPECQLIIAGEGDFNKCLISIKKCWSKVSFTGKIEKKQLYELYTIADIGVVCSIHEEFGLVIIEMMMHALAIVATNTSGLREIISDGISGLSVPIKHTKGKRQPDVKVLSEKIISLLETPSLAQQLGQNARSLYLEKYTLHTFKNNMLTIYQKRFS